MLPPAPPRDPIGWNAAITLAFAALALVRLAIPSTPMFDEIHYLPAARALLDGQAPVNLEHPPLGKWLIAGGMALWGDGPWGWRLPSLLAACLTLFALMRAMWLASGTRAASVLGGVLLGSNFLTLVHARIAMLDGFMLAFVLLALWMCAGALRHPRGARRRLALAGVALGAAMACKWNAIPLAVLPGLAFLALRWRHRGARALTARAAPPVPGIALWEAGVWLGLVPLAVYALSYAPYALFTVPPAGLIELHRQMWGLQTQVLEAHPYQSVWWQWVGNTRAIWYLYETVDGALRGVMVIGNPVAMLAGLPALAWCLWAGLRHGRADALAVALLYLASLALWVIAPKPVQFYFHYLLPATFLCAALALGVERLWQRGERLVPGAVVAGALGCFAWYYPILTAAPLADGEQWLLWAWWSGWQ